MNCKQVENNMLFYIDKEISDETATSFELHIAECQRCSKIFTDIKSTLQTIATDKLQEDDFYFYTRLNQRMENKQHQKSPVSFVPLRILKAVAISCLIAIGIFTGIKIGNQYNSVTNVLAAEENRTSQLNAYSEETYIAEINNEKIESLFTSKP